MKHFITLFLLALAVNYTYSQSKNHNEDFKIPNGNFENWYNIIVSASLNYDEIGTGPTDNWMGTLNSLAWVPPTTGGPGPVTVFKTTDKHSGTYAAKAVSADFPLGPITVFIPGMIGTAVMDNANIRAIMGKPCPDCRPSRFKGFYKFEPVGGDSCIAMLLVSKWNATAKKRDTIGFGRMVEHNAVSTYKEFDIPISYRSTETVDTMTMLVVASAGINFKVFTASQGKPGTTMYVDDLTVDYPSGIQQVLMPEVAVAAYPNPVKDILHLDLSKAVKDGSLEVYNSAGKQVGTWAMSQVKHSIPVSGLVNGTYYFRLTSGKDLVNSGTFVIMK
jgi:hypothetical protein